MAAPDGRLQWARDGADWPNRTASRFVHAAGLRWHVQVAGAGPAVLLLHGTGASTHTWRDVLPILARDFTVIAPDLPGHAFSEALPAARAGLAGMAAAIGALVATLSLPVAAVVGHSAGAAVGARWCLEARPAPRLLISLNGALMPLAGMPMGLFGALAKLGAATSLLPRLVAWRAQDPAALARLVASTGSTLDARGVELYRRLVGSRDHVASVLDMMAAWDLRPLAAALPQLAVPLVLVAADRDRTVPPGEAERVRALVPGAELVRLPGLGHLAHEEDPTRVASVLAERLARAGAPEAR